MKTTTRLLLPLLLLAGMAVTRLQAQTSTIYLGPFVGSDTVGSNPIAPLVLGANGKFYGAFSNGAGGGAIFTLTLPDSLSDIFPFDGMDGDFPNSLILAKDGNFYGTTELGGPAYNILQGMNGDGTIFKMTPAGGLTPLVFFNVTNGEYPEGITQGSDGNFYGTTYDGGAFGFGTVFQMTPAGVLTTLASFDATNGSYPEAGLVEGADHNFYGTTSAGGANGDGTIFKVTTTGTLTTLVSFNGINGLTPRGALIQAKDGNFYGTTAYGGKNYVAGTSGNPAFGTIFQMTPTGTLTSLVSLNGPLGVYPFAGLLQATDGNFYGTTLQGGQTDQGTVFRVNHSGTSWSVTTVASLDGSNGATAPYAPVIEGTDGNLYGTASGFGAAGVGQIFDVPLGLKGSGKVQTISFPAVGSVKVGQKVTLKATATSGLAITYRVVPTTGYTGAATISGAGITFTAAGAIKLAADQAGNSQYQPAPEVLQNVTVAKGSQTIAPFGVISTKTYGASFTITPPAATSGLAVTVKVKSGPAKISGDTISVTGVGAVVLTADQAGNANYSAAVEISTSFVVIKAGQTITFPKVTGVVGQTVKLAATSSSGLPITYSILATPGYTGTATLSGHTLNFTGAGDIKLAANQAGDADYNAATEVRQNVTVAPGPQTITFPAVGAVVVGQTVTLIAKSTSGLPVTYSIIPTSGFTGTATLSGHSITFTGKGDIKLAADQAGNANYKPASQVSQNVVITTAP